MNPFRMRHRNSSLMTTGFGRPHGLAPGSLMKHNFKDAWNEVSGWCRKHCAAHRSERYSPRFWGMTSALIAALRTTLFSTFDQNQAGNLANPPHSTSQQSQTER